jgi:threonylcarbamoyladenosine tRNA methylthiotransferase MtaB
MSQPSSFKFTTLGCRLNQAESDSMAEQLRSSGLQVVQPGEEPDVVVVNTCTVTREATKASRMALRRAVKSHPEAKVVAVGCYVVSDPEEVESIAGVDIALGNDVKESFAEALGTHATFRPLLQIGFADPPARSSEPPRIRANLKVQTGCDEWCTFCIIPTTRGPLRSLPEDNLIAEARTLVAAGARELVLTGVHLGKYAYDAGGNERDLIRLLARLLQIDGVRRIRLSSILSNHLTEELVAFIAAEERICPHLHVPLQSGDDGVLTAMHRPYRADDFVSAVEKAKQQIAELALATDIIVGFPGETDAAFESTMEIVQRVGFSKLHVFRYSARPGTASADMANEVHPDIKKERSKQLIALGNHLRNQFLQDHLHRPLEVLVEDQRAVDGVNVSSGQTADYVRVWFEGDDLLGRMAIVEGDRVRADGIGGRLLLSSQISGAGPQLPLRTSSHE